MIKTLIIAISPRYEQMSDNSFVFASKYRNVRLYIDKDGIKRVK